jgi:hypothetical protein
MCVKVYDQDRWAGEQRNQNQDQLLKRAWSLGPPLDVNGRRLKPAAHTRRLGPDLRRRNLSL